MDHLQGVCLYLAKVTGLFKNLRSFSDLNTEFKIPTVNSGIVAAIHVAGVRCDPCGSISHFYFSNFKIGNPRCASRAMDYFLA